MKNSAQSKDNGIDHATFTKWLDKFMAAPDPRNKIVPMAHACSDIESRVVIMFNETPDNPKGFMGQKSFKEIMKLTVRT